MAVEEGQGLSGTVQFLEDDICRGLRHGRRVRYRDVLPVRDELERLLRPGGTRHRSVDGV
ncbi:hypothetical protein D3C87_2185410 [compost metagenome]